ncbi:MAG: dihydrodipicolinate synthase family protein [Betaproteobacteria bacterium]|jgi:4-hydroxy-tetrahydrodipicolinate synthase|nr:dihydrodipicolinate synthase family protein [Betaproteobacteria bacterium]NBP45540.1 dihydrodipicolinate synthase family protein [Betaproteobacteria bacterium]
MLLNDQAKGVYPIAPTAFDAQGAIDTASMDRLTDFYVDIGATGITVLGQLGEAPKLSHAESISITRAMIQRAAKLPVVVGVSAPGFASMRALAQEVMAAGAAGVMIAPPNTLRTDDQIVSYYHQASEAIGTDIPIVLQDYPLTFSVQMSVGVIRRMVEDIPAIVMLKHEDWPGLEKISALRRFEAEGSMRHIAILCGNGGLFLDFELSRGADGANTGYAFPDMLCDLVRLNKAGDLQAAHDLFDAHLPLLRYEQQAGIGLAVRKHILMRRGLLSCDAQRKPGSSLSAQAQAEVNFLLDRLARFDPRARI